MRSCFVKLEQFLGALDVAVQSSGVTHVQAATVDVGTEQLILIGQDAGTLNVTVELCNVAHVDLAVAVDIADQVDLHILSNILRTHGDGVLTGNMVGLGNLQGVGAGGNIFDAVSTAQAGSGDGGDDRTVSDQLDGGVALWWRCRRWSRPGRELRSRWCSKRYPCCLPACTVEASACWRWGWKRRW